MEFSIDYPFFVFERASTADNKNFNMAIIVPSLIFMALAVLFWPVGASIRWHYGTKLDLTPSEKRLRLAVRIVCIVDLLFAVGWLIFISGTNDVTNLSRSRDPLLYLLEILGVIAATGTLIIILHAFRSWAKTGKWIWAKLFDVALALACISFTWFIWHWNLINFNLRY